MDSYGGTAFVYSAAVSAVSMVGVILADRKMRGGEFQE
jgi:hypothetical protein